MENIDLVNSIRRLTDNSFAASLVKQFDTRGGLSTKQWFWVKKISQEHNQPASAAVNGLDLTDLVTFMHDAGANLKFPKVRLETADGHDVVLNIAGPRAKRPGTINVTDGGPFGDNQWFGRIDVDGSFQPSRSCTEDVRELLISMMDEPAQVAAAHGHKTGNCCFCNRELTDERSTSVGFGPTCAENFGLAWGVEKTAA